MWPTLLDFDPAEGRHLWAPLPRRPAARMAQGASCNAACSRPLQLSENANLNLSMTHMPCTACTSHLLLLRLQTLADYNIGTNANCVQRSCSTHPGLLSFTTRRLLGEPRLLGDRRRWLTALALTCVLLAAKNLDRVPYRGLHATMLSMVCGAPVKPAAAVALELRVLSALSWRLGPFHKVPPGPLCNAPLGPAHYGPQAPTHAESGD